MPLNYDFTNEQSIYQYALQLEGKSFGEILRDKAGDHTSIIEAYSNKARKGGLGNLLEEVYFGYKANSNQEADFSEAGVELKVTCYEKRKDGSLKAGERLVLTMINYDRPIEIEFYKSHAWEKMRRILLIYYWRNRLENNNLMYRIGFVRLFTPPDEDLIIIKEDYAFITNKIKAGEAHLLSEADTMYLGACTKGASAAKSTVPQYYGDELAMRRAFCFKVSYMTFVLNNYIAGKGSDTEDCIIKDAKEIKEKKLVDILQEKLDKFRLFKTDDIAKIYGINTENKGYRALLAYAMLGVKGNKVEEFQKANIEVKTIFLNKRGVNQESFRLHDFRFKELASQEWEESDIFEQLESTQFLFVVFQETDKGSVYLGSMLWHMNEEDLETVREGWEAVKRRLNKGVTLSFGYYSTGEKYVKNNLPKSSDNEIFHVRPHQALTYYRFADGTVFGKGTPSMGDELPDGQVMPRHSYWLNREYILSILEENKDIFIYH